MKGKMKKCSAEIIEIFKIKKSIKYVKDYFKLNWIHKAANERKQQYGTHHPPTHWLVYDFRALQCQARSVSLLRKFI